MIERDVERKIIDAIMELRLDGLDITGTWQPSANGVVKGTERSDSTAGMVVKVAPRTAETFTLTRINLAVTLELAVRVDKDVTGAAFAEYADAILRLVTAWNINADGKLFAALATNEFDPAGVTVSSSDGPVFDTEDNVWTVTIGLSLVGAIIEKN